MINSGALIEWRPRNDAGSLSVSTDSKNAPTHQDSAYLAVLDAVELAIADPISRELVKNNMSTGFSLVTQYYAERGYVTGFMFNYSDEKSVDNYSITGNADDAEKIFKREFDLERLVVNESEIRGTHLGSLYFSSLKAEELVSTSDDYLSNNKEERDVIKLKIIEQLYKAESKRFGFELN